MRIFFCPHVTSAPRKTSKLQASSPGFSRGRNILNSAPASLLKPQLSNPPAISLFFPSVRVLPKQPCRFVDRLGNAFISFRINNSWSTGHRRDTRRAAIPFRFSRTLRMAFRCYVMAANGGNITRGKVFSSHGDQLSPPASTITPARFRMGQRCEVEVAEV